jgi:hypothetical protein
MDSLNVYRYIILNFKFGFTIGTHTSYLVLDRCSRGTGDSISTKSTLSPGRFPTMVIRATEPIGEAGQPLYKYRRDRAASLQIQTR